MLAPGWAAYAQEAAAPKPVTVQTVAALAQPVERSAPATVLSEQDSVVAAQITARVLVWKVRVGDAVANGAPLLQLECDDYEHALRGAEAALSGAGALQTLAQQQVERARNLLQTRHVSAETLDQRQAELAAARAERTARQAARDTAALNVRRCGVRAPFAGVVTERLADSGETVAAGAPLLRLVDAAQIELSAQLATEDAADAARASRWRFQAQGREWPVRLRVLLPLVDARTRHQEARFEITGGAPPAAGSSGRLLWQGALPQLPPQFLQQRGGVHGLFLADNGRARFLPLPGAIEGRPLAVELPPDARVVVNGREGLNAGDALKILP
jgi:RND family efflux transporter MFP subunit